MLLLANFFLKKETKVFFSFFFTKFYSNHFSINSIIKFNGVRKNITLLLKALAIIGLLIGAKFFSSFLEFSYQNDWLCKLYD